MSKQEEQKKMKLLLTEAITQLCKGGLHFETKFTVEALIGITLDDNDVFLVNINESIQNDFSLDTSTLNSQNFTNDRKSSNQISIKNENYDDENSDENKEFERNYSKNDQNINERNYFDPNRQFQQEGNDDNYQEQFSNSAINENQIPENNNMLHVKSENFDFGGGDEWMMNNNVELSENMSYSEQPSTHSFNSRGASYSLQAKRRSRGRPSFRSLGQHRMRPQNNQNEFMSSQQPMMDPNNTNINPNWVGVSSKNNEEIDKTLLGGRLISKWQCSVCSCIYSSERVLKEHIEALHLNKFLCQCKDCGQSFKWRHQLQKHRQSCIARINNHFIENELTQNINNNIVT